MWWSDWPWLCSLLRVQTCDGLQLVNYREIYLHGSFMGLLGNNWTYIHLWGLDILGLPGKLEGLTVYVGVCWQQVSSTKNASIHGELGSEKTHWSMHLQWWYGGILSIKWRCSFSVAGAVHVHSIHQQLWCTFLYRQPGQYFSVFGLSPKPWGFATVVQKRWDFTATGAPLNNWEIEISR